MNSRSDAITTDYQEISSLARERPRMLGLGGSYVAAAAFVNYLPPPGAVRHQGAGVIHEGSDEIL